MVSWRKYQEFVARSHALCYILSLPACLFYRFARHTLWKKTLVSNIRQIAEQLFRSLCSQPWLLFKRYRLKVRPENRRFVISSKLWTLYRNSFQSYFPNSVPPLHWTPYELLIVHIYITHILTSSTGQNTYSLANTHSAREVIPPFSETQVFITSLNKVRRLFLPKPWSIQSKYFKCFL